MTAKGSGSRYRVCEVCTTDYHATYTEQRTCGRECGKVLSARPERAAVRSTTLRWHQCSECPAWLARSRRAVCSRACALAKGRRLHSLSPLAAKPTSRPCRQCGQPHNTKTARNGAWCQRCQTKAYRHFRARARHHGVTYEPVNRLKVYERDRWTCQLCHRKVNRTAHYSHPQAPTLDHIIPMSQGGPHTYANVQLAHWRCNVLKGSAGGNEQLALTG